MKFKNKVVLREEDHQYLTVNGEKINLPSATSLVGLIFRFPVEEIDPLLIKAGSLRGTHFHKAMEIYLTLGIDYECCKIKSHAKQFEKGKELWDNLVKELDLEEIHSELPLYNNLYCGTIDVLAYSKKLNAWIIVDFKTTSWKVAKTIEKQDEIISKESLQLYLYSQLIPELHIDTFYIINSNKGQCYQLDEFHIRQAKWNYKWIINYLNKFKN